MNDKSKFTHAVKFLTDNRLAVISTVSHHSTPQSAFIYYVVDENYDIYFITTKESRKLKNILENNLVALVIAQEVEPYELQIEGIGEVIKDMGKKMVILDKYSRRANENPKAFNWPPLMQLKTDKGVEFMKINIQWFRYSEFSGTTPVIVEGTSEDIKKEKIIQPNHPQ